MSDFNQKFDEFNDTQDYTSYYSPEDIAQNRAMSIVSYLGILVLIPMLFGNKQGYIRFHVSQGFTLAIAEVISGIIFGIMGIIPILRILVYLLSSLVTLAFIIFSVIGIINAYNGNAKELPVFGKIHLIHY